MTRIIFGGAEVPSNRVLLEKAGVRRMSLSYWGLKRRGLPKTKKYLIAERFQEGVEVYLDSGSRLADKANLSHQELLDYAAEYEDFVEDNADALSGATEFDSRSLGDDWRLDRRLRYWSGLLDIFWPVWSPEDRLGTLDEVASKYPHLAISGESLNADTTLAGRTRLITARLHGLAIADPDELRSVSFHDVTSLAWLSPMRRGETVVWDGARLVRYPKRMKDQARMRLSLIAEMAGLDLSKIQDDDSTEVTRLAIWSYMQLEKQMHSLELSDNRDVLDDPGSAETGSDLVDNKAIEVETDRAPIRVRDVTEISPLPVFGYDIKTVVETDDEGNDTLRDVPVVRSSPASLRQCSTCFVASKCPAFEAQATCKFNLPVEIKTKDQLRSLLNAVIEMQGMRVAFARFTEELAGGYPDPNLSSEIDRLFKLVKSVKELESNNEFVRMTVERQSAGGVLSALFGDRATALRELPNGGIDAQQTNRILDGQM